MHCHRRSRCGRSFNNNSPISKLLELEVALCHDHYSEAGSIVNSKVQPRSAPPYSNQAYYLLAGYDPAYILIRVDAAPSSA